MGLHTLLILCLIPLWVSVSAETLTISNDISRTYSGVWTAQSPVFLRQTDLLNQRFFYETFEMNVVISGVYTFTSESIVKGFGYLYKDSFNPTDPKANLIAHDGNNENGGQFKIRATLDMGRKYILVATTNDPETTGQFSVIVSGFQTPLNGSVDSLMTKSIYNSFISDSLTLSNPIFYRPNRTDGVYYYQAFRVTIYSAETYSFMSNSSFDTFGYLYSLSFDPTYPNSNLIAYDDDSGSNSQFRIDKYLQYGTYILVVTTYAAGQRGSFGLRVMGPYSVDIMVYTPSIVVSSTTPGSSSSYSSSLTSYSPVFYRNGGGGSLYYYQAFRLNIYTPGQYTFSSTGSDFDTYGYLYTSSMDLSYPAQSLLAQDDDGSGGREFRIIYNVISSTTLILVVTSYQNGATGRFTVRTNGPTSVYPNPFTPVTSRPILTTQSTTILSPISYYGNLPSNNLVFFRPNQNDGYYYYEALRFTVSVSGTYTFLSSSSIDTYGLLYNSPVDPSYSSQNLITYDDDGGSNRQFRITQYLVSGRTYVLIVTTYASNVRGAYTLRTSGPQSVSFSSFTPSTSRPIRTTTSYYYSSGTTISSFGIVGIVFGCLFIIVLIVSVCTYSQKQRAVNARRVNNTYTTARVATTNVTRPNVPGSPYTIPMQPVYVHSVEEAPPSYDQVAAYLKTAKP